MLRITDIQDNRVDWASVPRCECDQPAKYLLRSGDIVIARTGATTGKSFLLGEVPEPSVFASYLIRVQPNTAVTPEYLANYMLSPTYWAQITTVSKGTAQPGANASILGGLELPLSPLNEQRRIVAKLEALQARSRRAREALDAVPQLLEKLRQSILAAAFRGDLTKDWRAKNKNVEPASKLLERIRSERRKKWEEAELAKMKAKGKAPADDRWKAKYENPKSVDATGLPGLPKGWCWARAEEVCHFITKGTTPAAEDLLSAGPVPFIKVYNLTFSGVVDFTVVPTFIDRATHDGPLARSKVFPGQVLMNIVGPPLGKVGIVPSTFPEWNMNQAIAVFPHVQGVVAEYLAFHLLSGWTLDRAVRAGKATAGQLNLTLEICRDLPVPLCPEREQEVVVERVRSALDVLERRRRETVLVVDALSGLEQAVLAKAFRGELVPQDPNDEPAEAMLARTRVAAPVAAAASRARAKRKQAAVDVSPSDDCERNQRGE